MSKRSVLILVAAFVLARGFLLWDAARPIHLGAGYGDMVRYEGWAQQVTEQNLAPYSQVAIEYPPGILPFIVAPEFINVGGDEYRERFVALMALVDAAGFVGLMLLARRHGSQAGPWLWIVAITVLGPIAYLRLDMVPAVATIWALERASAGAIRSSGALWGFGILAKLYPILLIPAVVITTTRRKELLIALGATVALVLLGFVGALDHVWQAVIGYHGSRGIQLESTWALVLLTAARRGYESSVAYGYGAYEVNSAISTTLKDLAAVTSIATLALGTWAIARGPRDDTGRLAIGLYGLLAGLLGVGTVLSPQFLVWLVALAAVAISFGRAPFRAPLLAIVPIALLTQIIFPYWYGAVVEGLPKGIVVLAARNLLLIGVSALVLLELWSSASSTEAPCGLS